MLQIYKKRRIKKEKDQNYNIELKRKKMKYKFNKMVSVHEIKFVRS
jgi:hypothetical protein